MPWDKDNDEYDNLYKRLFPPPKRQFTFTEIRNIFKKRLSKNEQNIPKKKS